MHISPLYKNFLDILDVSKYYKDHNAPFTPADKIYMSMADGRIPPPVGRVEYEYEEAYLELAVGGHLVIAKPERPTGGGVLDGEIGGQRGVVVGFSRQARNRLIRMIASTRKEERPIFATLTYPDEFNEDQARWKRDMDVFGKRFRRAFPEASYIWRIEFKERKSGKNAGQIAPHFHLLVWGPDILQFRRFSVEAWYRVVGSGNIQHYNAGTSSERVKTWNGVMSYVSKYIAKADLYPAGWTGRAWGIIGREHMPWAVRVVISLTQEEAIKLVRLGRRFCKLKGKVLTFGLTWLMDCESVFDYLEVIQGFT